MSSRRLDSHTKRNTRQDRRYTSAGVRNPCRFLSLEFNVVSDSVAVKLSGPLEWRAFREVLPGQAR